MAPCDLREYRKYFGKYRYTEIGLEFIVGMLILKFSFPLSVTFFDCFQTPDSALACLPKPLRVPQSDNLDGEPLLVVFSVKLSWFKAADPFFLIYPCKNGQLWLFGSLPKTLNLKDLEQQLTIQVL